MKTLNPAEQLMAIGACDQSISFVSNGRFETLQHAWDACPRGDWLLWFAGQKSGESESSERKKLVLAACECAREVLPLFEKDRPNDRRVRECIETTERWARGEEGVTLDDVRAKCSAASQAGHDDWTENYAGAAYAAAYAAEAASCGAAHAAAVSSAAATAVAYASGGARKEIQLHCANIVRKHYPKHP